VDKHGINNHIYDGKWVRSSLLSYFFLWNEISSQFHLQLQRAEKTASACNYFPGKWDLVS
jgi:hypothetical protein